MFCLLSVGHEDGRGTKDGAEATKGCTGGGKAVGKQKGEPIASKESHYVRWQETRTC